MFSINYPPGFTARPSPPEGEAEDSAFFLSPDRKVEFYVFSPMWDGEPNDIKLNPKTEKRISIRTVKKARPVGKDADGKPGMEYTRTTWVTIRAKNGSYTRSYVDTRDSLGPGPATRFRAVAPSASNTGTSPPIGSTGKTTRGFAVP